MLIAAALFDIIFALFHMSFARLLGWPRSLASSGHINAAVTQVLNHAITFIFFAAAFWLAYHHVAATQPRQFAGVLVTMASFWAFRAGLQPIYFGLSRPWSLALFAIFVTGAVLHVLPLL